MLELIKDSGHMKSTLIPFTIPYQVRSGAPRTSPKRRNNYMGLSGSLWANFGYF